MTMKYVSESTAPSIASVAVEFQLSVYKPPGTKIHSYP
jgi:hypothetical protein